VQKLSNIAGHVVNKGLSINTFIYSFICIRPHGSIETLKSIKTNTHKHKHSHKHRDHGVSLYTSQIKDTTEFYESASEF